MKKCPNCDKTFDDNLKFCQADGTPLVDADPPPDPFKTMVGSQIDFPVSVKSEPEKASTDKGNAPIDAGSEAGADIDVLEVPEPQVADPMKTMVAGGDTSANMGAEARNAIPATPEDKAAEPAVEAEPYQPVPPKFDEPEISPPDLRGVIV